MTVGRKGVTADLVLAQQASFETSAQPRQAYDVGNDYFQRSFARVWDNVHERLFKNTLRLAADLMIPPENALQTAIRLANTSNVNTLSDNIIEFIDLCHQRMKKEEDRAEELSKNCKSALLSKVNLQKLLQEAVVGQSIEFTFRCYFCILERVFKVPRLEDLYHTILRRAYTFCKDYNRPDYHRDFSENLTLYRSGIENPKPEQITKIIQSSIVCYKTSLDFRKYQRALFAINDAFTYSLKLASVNVDLEREIEEMKLNILQLTGNKLFAAVQRYNLIVFYLNHPNAKSEMPISQMVDLCLMETAAAPLFEEVNTTMDTINFPLFLNQSSGNIPTRSELLKRLLARSEDSPVSRFVAAAEAEKNPFKISRAYQAFLKAAQEQYPFAAHLIPDLSQYAAIRVVDRVRLHYDSISFTELATYVPWMTAVQIEQLLVHAARSRLIPAHINMAAGSVSLVPREVQVLTPAVSTVNGQLKAIFDTFKGIDRLCRTPEFPEANARNIKRIYTNTYSDMIDRPAHLELVISRINKEKEEQRRREAAAMEEERRRLEAAEKEQRQKEVERTREKRRLEDKYEYIYAECQIICEKLHIDLKKELETETADHLRPKGIKHEDVLYIETRCAELKVKYVKAMRSHSDLMAKKMTKVKDKIGGDRITARLATQKFIKEKVLDKQIKMVPKFVDANNKSRLKAYKAAAAEYKEVKALAEATKDAWAAYGQKVADAARADRQVLTQPMPAAYQKQVEEKRKAEEEEAKRKAAEEAKKKAEEEEAKKRAEEEEAKKKAEEEEAKKKAAEEEEAKKKAEEEEAKKKAAEEEAKKKAEEPPKKKTTGWGNVDVKDGGEVAWTGSHAHRQEQQHVPRSDSRDSMTRSGSRDGMTRSNSRDRNAPVPGQRRAQPQPQPDLAAKFGSASSSRKQQPPPPREDLAAKFGGGGASRPSPAERFGGSGRTQQQQPQPPQPRRTGGFNIGGARQPPAQPGRR